MGLTGGRVLQAVEALVARGQPIPILLPDLVRLETLANSAKAWRERTSRAFRRNSLSLLEVRPGGCGGCGPGPQNSC